jgi:hypothetical protein
MYTSLIKRQVRLLPLFFTTRNTPFNVHSNERADFFIGKSYMSMQPLLPYFYKHMHAGKNDNRKTSIEHY